ncbi:MAG: right-handed parallel beta-helix repeat-containing protein [Candidatus Hodarchaeota archaeon]
MRYKKKKRSLLELFLIITCLGVIVGSSILNDIRMFNDSAKKERWTGYGRNLIQPFKSGDFKTPDISSTVVKTESIQEYPIQFIDINSSANGVCIENNLAYIADSSENIHVVDITHPLNPTVLTSIPTNKGSIDKISVADGYAFVLEGGGLFSIYDIRDIYNSTKIFEDYYIETFHLVVDNDFAYITADDQSVVIYNVSNPMNPSSRNTIIMNHSADGLFKYQDWLYVGLKEDGLALINVSDPSNPGSPIYYPSVGTVNSIFVNDYSTYLGDDNGCFLSIYNFTNSSSFELLYQIGSAHAFDVWATKDYAYVLEDGLQFSVYNVTNITSSHIIKSYRNINAFSRSINFAEGFVYIAHDISGLAIIDVREFGYFVPHTPITITQNSDFGPSGYNFTGTGSESDPYLIEGFNITHLTENLIDIQNTSVHFNIKSNWLNGITNINNLWGINLKNVTNGMISDNVILYGWIGIKLEITSNITLKYNLMEKQGIALSTYNSNNTYVQRNGFHDTTQASVGFYHSSSCSFLQNNFHNNLHAIWMDHGENNSLEKNIIRECQDDVFVISEESSNNIMINNNIKTCGGGITIAYASNNNNITHNIINQTSNIGIHLNEVNNCSISNNTITRNTDFGIKIQNSNLNEIIYNNFIENNPGGNSQAFVSGNYNIIEYNFWNDWISPDDDYDGIVDFPYELEGDMNYTDSFPLSYPSGSDSHHLIGLSVLYPNGGEIIYGSVTIEWVLPKDNLNHEIIYYISYSSDSGTTWNMIVGGVVWTSLVWDTAILSNGGNYLVKVEARCSEGLMIVDTSDSTFEIYNEETTTPETTLPPTSTEPTSTIPETTTTTTTYTVPAAVPIPDYGENVERTYYEGEIYLDSYAIPLSIEMIETNYTEMIGDRLCTYSENKIEYEKSFTLLTLDEIELKDAKITGIDYIRTWNAKNTGENVKRMVSTKLTIAGEYKNEQLEMTTQITTITDFLNETIVDNQIEYFYNIVIEVSIYGKGINSFSGKETFISVYSWIEIDFILEETITCADRNEYNTNKIEFQYKGWDWSYDLGNSGRVNISPVYSNSKNYVWVDQDNLQMVKTEEYNERNDLIATYSIANPDNGPEFPIVPLAAILALIGGGAVVIFFRRRALKLTSATPKLKPNLTGTYLQCSQCGNINLIGYTFCIHCGNKL